MILCTVGTHDRPFDRLVIAVDEFAAITDEKVIIQRGCSTYIPQHAEHFQFTTHDHMQELTHQSRIIITHAAAGSIILALTLKIPIIVIPRLRRFDEVIDDHQLELTQALSNNRKAIVVGIPTAEYLFEAINRAVHQPIFTINPSQLVDSLRLQLAIWSDSFILQNGSVNQED